MHTLIGPDDSQTQWLSVPFVAIDLGTNSLVGWCLVDRHRRGKNITLLASICQKMDQEKLSLHAQFGPLNVGSASPDSRPDIRWSKNRSSQLGPMATPRVGVPELKSRLERLEPAFHSHWAERISRVCLLTGAVLAPRLESPEYYRYYYLQWLRLNNRKPAFSGPAIFPVALPLTYGA